MAGLSLGMKKYVLNADKGGYTKETRAVYDKRLWRQAKSAVELLTFLADNLWEENSKNDYASRSSIFNSKMLEPLFRSLFRFERNTDTKQEQKRLRVLELCNCALEEIGNHNNGPTLAPSAWKVLKELPSSAYDEIYGTKVIQAIQIEEARFVPTKEEEGVKP